MANYTKITDHSTCQGLGIPCVLQMRWLIGQQYDCFGIGSLCSAKKEVVTARTGATGYAK